MRLTIGVMASSSAVADAVVEARLAALGRAVAKHECRLITGACPRLPCAAVRGAKSAGGLVVGISPGLLRDEHVKKYRSPVEGFDVIILTGSELMNREVENIRSSDTVATAGGHSGLWASSQSPTTKASSSEGVADAVPELVATCARETGAVVIYDDQPTTLVERLVTHYGQEHYKHRNCFHDTRISPARMD